MKIIWAFGEEDPVDEMVMERHAQRGVKSIYLKEPSFAPPPLTEDIEAWDIRAPNVRPHNHIHLVMQTDIKVQQSGKPQTYYLVSPEKKNKDNLVDLAFFQFFVCIRFKLTYTSCLVTPSPPQVSLPSHTDTVYWCKLYKAPDYVNGAHIIGVR